MTHQTSLVAYQAYAKLTVLSGAWWDTQHCLPGQELNWCYLSDIIQDAWGQRKLKVTNTCCPEPKLNCRSTCRVGQNTYCFFWLTPQCVFLSKPVDGIRQLTLDRQNSQGWGRTGFCWCAEGLGDTGGRGEEMHLVSHHPFDCGSFVLSLWKIDVDKSNRLAAWRETGKLRLFQIFHKKLLPKKSLFQLGKVSLLEETSAIESQYF